MNFTFNTKLKSYLILMLVWILAFYFWELIQFPAKGIPEDYKQFLDNKAPIDFTIVIGGIFMGLNFIGINTFMYKKKAYFNKMSYGKLILLYSLIHFISYFIITLLVTLILIYIAFKNNAGNVFDNLEDFFLPNDLLRIVLYTYVVSISIYFMQIINQKFGPGVLRDLVLGKYRKPKERKLIFLFMDLKSSTTYAEKLGHIKYSQLIQDCFSDLSKVIPANQAQVYQYVGDEVVLQWPYDTGISNANCVNLFFQFKEILLARSSYYMANYNCIPEFKAGLNGGYIMTAEVGVIKRSIAYHGDVINTASRIQHQCNTLMQEILISSTVIRDLPDLESLEYPFINYCKLKGKDQKVSLFGVQKTVNNQLKKC